MRRRPALGFALLAAALLASGGRAQPAVPAGPAPPWRLVLDPGATRVDFELGATLHTVRGTFEVRHGELRFDPAGGAVAGRVVVDAASGRTGNARRDRNMHADVLESARHPEIALAPERLEVASRSGDGLRGVLHGRIEICGGSHAVAIPVEARRIGPERARVEGRFEAPYVEWGLEDPSTFVLGVDPVVSVRFAAEGRLSGP